MDWGDTARDEQNALRALEIDIIQSPDWGGNVEELTDWTAPDPGFNQPHSTDSDYDDEIVHLSDINDESFSPEQCEFIDSEAREGRRDTPEEEEETEVLEPEVITLESNSDEEARLPQAKRSRRAIIFDSDSE